MLYSCNLPGHPSSLLTSSFILYCGGLLPHGMCGPPSLEHTSFFHPHPLRGAVHGHAQARSGILSVLSVLGPDAEKRPVQVLEEGSGSFGKGIPGSWVPGVWSRREVWSSRLMCPLGHGGRAWPEKSKSELSNAWVQGRGLSCPHRTTGIR